MLSRGMFEQPVEDGDAVEACHCGQPPADGRSGESPFLHCSRPQLDVPPLDGEDLEVQLGAPGEVLAQIGGVARPRWPGIPGQEAGHGNAVLRRTEPAWG